MASDPHHTRDVKLQNSNANILAHRTYRMRFSPGQSGLIKTTLFSEINKPVRLRAPTYQGHRLTINI